MTPGPIPESFSFARGGRSTARNYPFWGWEDFAIFAGMVLPSLVMATLAVKAVASLIPQWFRTPATTALPSQGLLYLLLFASLWGLLRWKYSQPFWRSMAWSFSFSRAWLFLVTGPVIAFAVSSIGVTLRAPPIETPFEEFVADRASTVLFLLFAVVIGPLCEELAFRGFLYPLIERDAGPHAGYLLAALPFALLHGRQYQWAWQQLLLVYLAGVFFGWIRYRWGSTGASTLVHSSYNLTFFAGFVLLRG